MFLFRFSLLDPTSNLLTYLFYADETKLRQEERQKAKPKGDNGRVKCSWKIEDDDEDE
jgi:hypothetical protein